MKRTILSLILAAFSSAPMLTAQEKMGDPEKLGKVHFPVSCTPTAQQQFDRALALLPAATRNGTSGKGGGSSTGMAIAAEPSAQRSSDFFLHSFAETLDCRGED